MILRSVGFHLPQTSCIRQWWCWWWHTRSSLVVCGSALDWNLQNLIPLYVNEVRGGVEESHWIYQMPLSLYVILQDRREFLKFSVSEQSTVQGSSLVQSHLGGGMGFLQGGWVQPRRSCGFFGRISVYRRLSFYSLSLSLLLLLRPLLARFQRISLERLTPYVIRY